MKKNKHNKILCLADLHLPFEHKDVIPFLKAIKDKFKPDTVVDLGDTTDHQALNFHDSDVDLPSAGDELLIAIKKLKALYKLFPEAYVLDSNHGSMAIRKCKHHGIPMKYIKTVEEVLEAPKGWNWINDLVLDLPNGQQVYFHHGLKKNGLLLAQQMGMSVVQGHYHTEFNIKYASSPNQLYWSMQVGCLIDDKSLAFAYNKTTLGRPILGCGIILNGIPRLLPMILDKKGRWIKEVI